MTLDITRDSRLRFAVWVLPDTLNRVVDMSLLGEPDYNILAANGEEAADTAYAARSSHGPTKPPSAVAFLIQHPDKRFIKAVVGWEKYNHTHEFWPINGKETP